ncbi:gamma-glutamylputrescine synthetase [Zobellella denitrificans]|uniref:Gamma-glutamylputrescine synthetase n=2 Tax=Zobellella denitrificans TaxID=347534 RepID=A0A291HSA8_9GAMM|nr:gamma-glutamylputrescine synthetase [Zobellella denitrificans]
MQAEMEMLNPLAQVEPLVPSDFEREVADYLARYPDTQYVDVLLTDLNGIFRGKRLPVSALDKLEAGCFFPGSVFAMDFRGNVVEETGIGQDIGEPDLPCFPIADTLVPSACDPDTVAQLLLTMVTEDEQPFPLEPRNVLARVWEKVKARGLRPVVALELEFYLVDRERDEGGRLQPPCSPLTQKRDTYSQVYSVDNLNNFAEILADIDNLAIRQGLPADGAVAEAAPGQFEINLYHTDDVLAACDQALALKRLIKLVAEQHEMDATFMAKPYEEHAGSGLHVHISVVDDRGDNLFVDEDGEDSALLHLALSGMLDLMPDSMALLAPNMNSFRRFQPGMYVPTQASWGHNNRTVALRIPCGDDDARRIEYRVAGADANPYLVVAAILAGLLHGLDNTLPLPAPVVGNGLEQEGLPFPTRQSEALQVLAESQPLKRYLGEEFIEVYRICKHDELLEFERRITDIELEWMLKNA